MFTPTRCTEPVATFWKRYALLARNVIKTDRTIQLFVLIENRLCFAKTLRKSKIGLRIIYPESVFCVDDILTPALDKKSSRFSKN